MLGMLTWTPEWSRAASMATAPAGRAAGRLPGPPARHYLLGEDSQIVLCEVSPVSKVLRLIKLWVRLSA